MAPKLKRTSFLDCFVISQSNLIYQNTRIILTFVCIISSCVYAFFAAFRYDIESFQIISKEELTRNDFGDKQIEYFTYFFYAAEGVCFLDFLAQFCLEYQGFDDPNPVRQINLTAKRYAYNEMVYDLIPLIPFTMFLKFKHSRLLFLIKTIRIKKSLSLLDTKKFS